MAEESVNCLDNNLKDPLQSGLGDKAPVWAPWRYEEPETWERLFPPSNALASRAQRGPSSGCSKGSRAETSVSSQEHFEARPTGY